LVTKTTAVVFRFGLYESHPKTLELYKHGTKLKVRPQPLRLLNLLLSRAGQVLTREEIQQELWSAETFVDFEHSLNTAIGALRGALNDSVAKPTYIETLPKIGYRFVALVSVVTDKTEDGSEPSGPLDIAAAQLLAAQQTTNRVPLDWAISGRFLRLWPVLIGLIILTAFAFVYHARRFIARQDARTASERTVLAVLPFQNLSGGADEDYFSDGLTEEMIAQFGRLDPEHLGVIARTSVMHYKHSDESLEQIGRELGVQYALEGSVRRDANKVRISAQLIKIADQTRLWSREYDRELSDLLTLQSEIAHDIGGEIRIALNEKKKDLPVREATLSPESIEAYDLYLKALYFWNKRTAEGFERAIDYFQQSVNKDAGYSRAYAGLADSYALMSGYAGRPPRDLMEKARAAAQKAVELDGTLAEGHTAKAIVAQNFDWDWQTAEKEYQRAIELNPNYATAHHWYAEYLALMGRFDEASVEIEKARLLDPLSLIIATDHGVILYYARQYDRAIEQLRTVRDMDPEYPRADIIDTAYLQKGMDAEALADLEKWKPVGNEAPWFWGERAYLEGRLGKTDEARRAMEKLRQMNHVQQIDPIIIAIAYLGMNDKRHALDWLEKAHSDHSVSLTSLKVDPIYDPLRGEPRFQELLRGMRLVN
jgi:TolB-like protein/DNA-binding winged helix-turn-helix (wHTH) protein